MGQFMLKQNRTANINLNLWIMMWKTMIIIIMY